MTEAADPSSAIASPSAGAPATAASAGLAPRRPGTRLEQAVRGAARSAIKRGEAIVQIRTTIKLGKARSAPKHSPIEHQPVLRLDPAQIVLSRWAPRQEQSFNNSEFLKLKESIRHDGENQIPILVRPLPSIASAAGLLHFELAYGHRRLRACRELELPVRAIVEELTEGRLVERMHAENRERAKLSAYEAGLFYKRLLEAKLYASQRKMAQALGIDQADATRKIWLASLPADFIQVFKSPLEISCDDIRRLQTAWRHDAAGLQAQALKVLDVEGPLPARQAVGRLLCGAGPPVGDGGSITSGFCPSPSLSVDSRAVVEIREAGPDGVTFRVNARFARTDLEDLMLQVEEFVQSMRCV
ncbi:ParB/RepB/Spo0J family partition protein [Roseateles sp. LKC17W]|uniref:ParB/RepB/Spo0J family partition protein n=1 Tax=Pelomonas margarita TaxID=3299031 RepID=A0ABW7FNY4_9BURK